MLLGDVGPQGLLLAGVAFADHADAELLAVGDRVSGSSEEQQIRPFFATEIIALSRILSTSQRDGLSINSLYSATSPLPFVQLIHLRAEQDAGDET